MRPIAGRVSTGRTHVQTVPSSVMAASSPTTTAMRLSATAVDVSGRQFQPQLSGLFRGRRAGGFVGKQPDEVVQKRFGRKSDCDDVPRKRPSEDSLRPPRDVTALEAGKQCDADFCRFSDVWKRDADLLAAGSKRKTERLAGVVQRSSP